MKDFEREVSRVINEVRLTPEEAQRAKEMADALEKVFTGATNIQKYIEADMLFEKQAKALNDAFLRAGYAVRVER